MHTTLNKIRAHNPCAGGWKKLLAHLGKTKADDEPLALTTIIDSNGLDDAIWCLRAVDGHDREIRLFAVWCARQVQHLMKDKRSLDALDVSERYANGEATDEELSEARAAAEAAARAAAEAAASASASAAARVAASASAAAEAVAEAVACRAAWSAAWSAESAEAWSTAWAAAWSAARASQEAELRRICNN